MPVVRPRRMPVLAAILLFAAAVLAALNWGCVWRNLRARGGHHSSPVLLIGVFVGALGLASWPERPRFAWLLLFGDPGTPLGIAALPRLLVAMFHFSRLNLHAEYVGSEHRLRLYRHGEFLLSFNPLDRSKHPVPLTTGAGGTW